jgi:hypothetical protein
MFGIFKKLFGLPTAAEEAKAKAVEAPYKVETPAPAVKKEEAKPAAKPAAKSAPKAPAKKADAPKKPAVVAKTGGKGRKPKAK